MHTSGHLKGSAIAEGVQSSFLTPTVSSEDPETTFRFDNRHRPQRKLSAYYGYSLSQGKDTALISQGKKCMRQSPREVLNEELPVILSPWSQDNIAFLTLMCDSMHGVLPFRKLLQALVLRVFIETPSLRHGSFPRGKSQSPTSQEVELILKPPPYLTLLLWLKTHTLSPIITIWLAQCPQARRKTPSNHDIPRA